VTTEATIESVPSSVAIAAPNPEELRRGAASALDLVQSFEITDAATFEIAADELKAIKTKIDALSEKRLAITRPLDAAKAAVMSLFKPPVEVLQEAERMLKSKMLAWQQAEAAKAREAQLAAERAAQAERERLEAEAKALAAEGRTGEAAVKEQVAQMVVASPIAAPAPPAVKGISTSTTIDFEVTDLHALVKAAAEKPELVALLAVDSVKLRAYVKGLGLQTNLPGVRVFQKQTLAARR
jgi:NADH dehydrogenase/NADH:ubiquinone oxidoreductase subunit G